MRRRKLVLVALGAVLALGATSPALAGNNPGYEGKPGHQSNGGGGGPNGYEGHPGNQGGH